MKDVRKKLPPSHLSVRTHYKFRKIRSFLHQKVRTSASEEPLPLVRKNVRTEQIPLTADVFYGHWTAPKGIPLSTLPKNASKIAPRKNFAEH